MLFGALKTNDFGFALPRAVWRPCPIDSVCINNKYGNTSDPTGFGTRKHFSRTL